MYRSFEVKNNSGVTYLHIRVKIGHFRPMSVVGMDGRFTPFTLPLIPFRLVIESADQCKSLFAVVAKFQVFDLSEKGIPHLVISVNFYSNVSHLFFAFLTQTLNL